MNRSIVTLALALVLLLAGLLAPVADARPPEVVPDVVVERLGGLPRGHAPPPTGASRAFAGADDVRTSEAVTTPIPFSMVGFEAAEEVPVWFRTSVDGTSWSPWRRVTWQEEEGPDPGSAEAAGQVAPAMSAPAWVGEAGWLQTRTSGGAAPEDVAAHLVDSVGLGRGVVQRAVDALLAAWRGGQRAAEATVGQPSIVTREQWGADESLRNGGPSYAPRVRLAFVHHTAGRNDYGESDVPGIVRGIYAYHTQARGWNDIGYNFLVDRFGRVFEGRAGGMDRAVVGAHAMGFNTGSVGVAVLGDFSGAEPTSRSLEAVSRLLAWSFDVHHVDVERDVTVESGGGSNNRYPAGTSVTLASVNGHRDTGYTTCPARLYGHLPAIRTRVAALASDMLVDPAVSPPVLVVGGDHAAPGPISFTTRLKPAGEWELEVRGPTGAVLHRATGSGSRASVAWRPATLAPGTYTYAFRAPGRRDATGAVRVHLSLLDRVGDDPDAVTGAVQVSRVAFPAAGSARHAVVARADVFADAMAGGPLAGTGGPLLLTGRTALDGRVRAELERVLPAGRTVYVLGGLEALDAAVVDGLADRWRVQRLGGAERTETAALVAARVRARSGRDTVLLARSGPDEVQPWADAMAGGAYGASTGIPVLLTPGGRLTPATREALRDVDRTIVLGGHRAISSTVLNAVPNPYRVAGPDRAGTAAEIAKRLWGRRDGAAGDRLVLAGGYHERAWTMTLASAPLAARNAAPVLLSGSGTLPPGTRDYLVSLAYGDGREASGWVVGGSAVVGHGVVEEVSHLLR